MNILFEKTETDIEKEWVDMPEFIQKNKLPVQKIVVNFETYQDVLEFAKIIGFKPTNKTKSIWFPFKQKDKPKEYAYVDTDK